MKTEAKQIGSEQRYRALLTLLERTHKFLISIKADPDVVASYALLVHVLQTRSTEMISQIFGQQVAKKIKAQRKEPVTISHTEILALSGDDVRTLATNPDTPRMQLESIAAVRYGVTKGALSNLRTRASLVDKLTTLVANENTQDAIVRVAQSRVDTSSRGDSDPAATSGFGKIERDPENLKIARTKTRKL